MPSPNEPNDAERSRLEDVEPPVEWTPDAVAHAVVDCGYKLHVELGPGLFESVYEVFLARMLELRGLSVERQVPVAVDILGLHFDEGFRADMVVNRMLLVELKSIPQVAPVHVKQVLTYLRLLRMPVGLLINFGGATFKEGVTRVANRHREGVDPSERPTR